ncbi:MAG: phosphoenolpyruvate carboxylase [Bdellovibrionota bacterium]|nr:phosphoenolpyruvate carboxylase [Bdellovibrionota bacterium]
MSSIEHLPLSLRSLIRKATDVYGKAIKEVHGRKVFNQIEDLRVSMKSTRTESDDVKYALLKKKYQKLQKLPDEELMAISHVYSLYMELINRCEAVYRKYRLKEKEGDRIEEESPYAVIYVFTAHPTEARSPESLELFKVIESILYTLLWDERSRERESQRLHHIFKILLRTSMAKMTPPEVLDEAHQIYETVLDSKILREQVMLHQRGITAHFRTWVGGDKDGHPFVESKVMLASLQRSRKKILSFVSKNLKQSQSLLKGATLERQTKSLLTKHDKLAQEVEAIRTITNNDGKKIKRFRAKLLDLLTSYEKTWGEHNFYLKNIQSVSWLYPALVLPLEFREDSEVIASNNEESQKINGMLSTLKEISNGYEAKWYVRGLVLSMVASEDDILNGISLVRKHFKDQVLPVVPLFETKQALVDSSQILKNLFKKAPEVKERHISNWDGRFEVMLGYSDSAKENGTLTSRYLISKTLIDLDKVLKRFKLTPVFFHGNGGSIERGGGSIKEQIGWWPKSAINIFKSTIQGEMVSRNFGTPEIMRSQIAKIYSEFHQRGNKVNQMSSKAFDKLIEQTNQNYKDFVTADSFPEFVAQTTPYNYLDQLKIGSRPSSRNKSAKQFKIRAIPWVLCWTQTRVLFPTWWGIGSAWEELELKDKYDILQFYAKSSFFKSFMKILGFTLAKVELSVFKLYLEENLSGAEAKEAFDKFHTEYLKAKTFFHEVTREDDLLWFRPWLEESVRLRAPMIHPLNLIQLISLKKKDARLLRVTVTGIASGMMTTG